MAKNIDVTEHELVPPHEVLSEEEKRKVLEKFNISPQQLPKIRISDPALEGKAVSQGDVVRIRRESETAGSTVYYRLVIGE